MLNERAFLKWPSRWNTPFHQTLNNEELRLQVGNLRFEVLIACIGRQCSCKHCFWVL